MGQQVLNKEDRVSGLKKSTKAKGRNWKLQARVGTKRSEGEAGPISSKRLAAGTMILSPQSKKARIGSPSDMQGKQIQVSSSSTKLKLVWEDAEQKAMEVQMANSDKLSAKVGD